MRPEDFPVMPVESAGFTLKPVGFFRGNPGIDIPYQPNAASKLCCGSASGQANGQAKGQANGQANGHSANGSSVNGHANGHGDDHSNGVQDAVNIANEAGSMNVVEDAIKAAAAESGAGSMNGILSGQATEIARNT